LLHQPITVVLNGGENMILDLMWEFDFYVLYIAKHIPRDSYSIERSYKKSYVLVLYPIRNIDERLKRDIPYLAGASTLKGMRLTNIANISFVQNQMEENVFTLLKVIFVLRKSFSGLRVQTTPK